MIVYPERKLPLPVVEFDTIRKDATTRFETDDGRTLQRRRFTHANWRGKMTFQFTAQEYRLFIGFYEYWLHNGMEEFFITLPTAKQPHPIKTRIYFAGDMEIKNKLDCYEVTIPFVFPAYPIISKEDFQDEITE